MKKQIWLIMAFMVLVSVVAAPVVFGTDYTPENCPPIAENMKIKTFEGVAVSGTVSATEPDGEAVTFYISEATKKGSLEFAPSGEFTYTPYEGTKGKDCFYFYAVDEAGGVSNTATVKIVVEKQKTAVRYSDLEGDSCRYSALLLAEKGIYVGESLGNDYFFDSDMPVTRGRFLAMCMKLCGAEVMDGVAKTGYDDDGDIPMWTKPYVAAALMTGVLDASRKQFNSESAITYGEAAVLLNSAMNITDVHCDGDSVCQAFDNLSACRIIDREKSADADKVLTMGEAAKLLSGAYELLENRER